MSNTVSTIGDVEEVAVQSKIPLSIIADDVPSYMKTDFNNELKEIFKFYRIYDKGAKFVAEGTNGDYTASDKRYKKCRSLINKEARFMFSNPPDVYINKNTAHTDEEKSQSTIINDYIQKVFEKNGMSNKLLKAAKDCFIGKRVACVLNFNEEKGISISFLRSYEFLYELNDVNELTKFIGFYTVIDSNSKTDMRIKKKLYEMHDDGFCYVTEVMYDGMGNVVEEILQDSKTEFQYVPAAIIINDGLSNDIKGESEITNILDDEQYYSKLANADIDAQRKGMNAVRYTIDADPNSTQNLSTAPGAFWDIKTNDLSPNPHTAQVGMLEPSMNYSGTLKTTLDRLNDDMHDQLDVPDINSEKLQGVITSGKTLKALYWGLTTRCNEKMLAWTPALTYVVKALIDGAILYPTSAEKYTDKAIPEMEMLDISINNNYAILEDDMEEKASDMAEVAAQTLSRKSYMKKWRGLTDEEADEELKQILLEKQLLEDSAMPGGFEEEPEGQLTGEEPELEGAEPADKNPKVQKK